MGRQILNSTKSAAGRLHASTSTSGYEYRSFGDRFTARRTFFPAFNGRDGSLRPRNSGFWYRPFYHKMHPFPYIYEYGGPLRPQISGFCYRSIYRKIHLFSRILRARWSTKTAAGRLCALKFTSGHKNRGFGDQFNENAPLFRSLRVVRNEARPN